MAGDDRPTRRQVLAGTGALAGTLLAGCASGTERESTETTTAAATGTETGTVGTATTSGPEPYSVSMAPVGEVTFEEPPTTWLANNGSWADMGVALGVEPPEGVWLTGRYHTGYYDEIPGVDVDTSGMRSLYQDGVSEEVFYEVDADVHVVDPNFLRNRFKGWDESDVETIERDVAPFFGNSVFSRGYGWHEDYRYYTLYEAFEKLAAVFQRTERYEAFAALHDEFQDRVADVVPPADERPDVAVFWGAGDEPERFYPYVMNEGTSFKQWNDLGVGDALAKTDVKDFHATRAAVDFETMLEVDPEVVLLRGQEGKSEAEFRDTVVSYMADHPVAGELSAVESGDVYRAGPLYQGPIQNLVTTERAARQVYDVEGELFDRERVADVVRG